MADSIHYTDERKEREKLIEAIGLGNTIASALIDKGHPNGAEIHQLSDTGIITIYNARTHIMVTRLIARPGQLYRFYPNGNIPRAVLNLARTHQRLGYNLV